MSLSRAVLIFSSTLLVISYSVGEVDLGKMTTLYRATSGKVTLLTDNKMAIKGLTASGFTKLGKFHPKQKSKSMKYDETDYYISDNQAAWASARDDCERKFEPDGHLLAFETKEEWDFILKELSKYGSGYVYWTSGAYDSALKTFRWFDGSEIPKWAPWLPNHPPKKVNFRHRLMLINNGEGNNSFWAVKANTKPLRYICEESLEPEPA